MAFDLSIQTLRQSRILSDLDEADLTALVLGGVRRTVEPGACLISEGDDEKSLFIILDGEVEVYRTTPDGDTLLARLGAGQFVGEMALVDDAPRSATVRAVSQADILEITEDQFDRLLNRSPGACRTLVRTVLRRLRSTEAMLVNQEKLASLGRLSAGLAHELNNPASAMSRTAQQLVQAIDEWKIATRNLSTVLPAAEFDALLERHADSRETGVTLSSLDRATRETELERWLEERAVPEPWNLAGDLVTGGWTPALLEAVARQVSAHQLGHVISWLATDANVSQSAIELTLSAERISDVVSSVKAYSHMDQAPSGPVDINHGIESTLVMLGHKLRGIALELDLEPDMPNLDGFTAELNQVWTNLIDNAIDTMDGTGTLRVSSHSESGLITVEVTDSGPGIPDGQKHRVFEPFFTTKPVGVGTGLGLHISHNIVVHRHGGRIAVDSEPGRTTFTVSLPLRR